MKEYMQVTKKLFAGLGAEKSRLLVELLDESVSILEKNQQDGGKA